MNVNTTRPAFPSNAATGLHEPEVAAANSVRPPAVAGLVGRRRGIRPAGLVAGEGHMAGAVRQRVSVFLAACFTFCDKV